MDHEAMDLTEPQAGSDLGGIRTRVAVEDGRYYVDGEKIFITNGGADIQLVLARDDATSSDSKGTTRGLSLILCPRGLPDGKPNGVLVSRVERKQGFRAMLDLMNNACLGVAAQALATVFVNRHMLNVERSAKRIITGDASRLQRYDQILKI